MHIQIGDIKMQTDSSFPQISDIIDLHHRRAGKSVFFFKLQGRHFNN